HRIGGQKISDSVEYALSKRMLRSVFLKALERRDQISLRLHHFRAVNFEQRIAALNVVAEFADHACHTTREWCQHNGTGVLIECDLTDRLLLQTEWIRYGLHNVQLMHLVRRQPDDVCVARGSLKGRLRGCAVSNQRGRQHGRQKGTPRPAQSSLECVG